MHETALDYVTTKFMPLKAGCDIGGGEAMPLDQRAVLVEWLRAESGIHPVLVAGIAQFQFVHIHPFIDGNGRTSRLLSIRNSGNDSSTSVALKWPRAR